MKKIISIVSLLLILCSFGYANAQTGYQAIVLFDSIIQVNTDNSIDVQEKIVYSTGPLSRHGIFRDIKTLSSQNRKMDISNISVVDENGESYMYVVSQQGSSTQIKIGDPDVVFTGQKTYIIQYNATRAVGQFDNLDEIYWNVTGNEWQFPILKSHLEVTLPDDIRAKQMACYYGISGSKNECEYSSFKNKIFFQNNVELNSAEGMTVAVGFAKGVVTPYSASDSFKNFFELYTPWLLAALLPIVTLIFSLWYWHKKGRDPKGTGVIIPQYEVLEDLTPMEVIGIVKQSVPLNSISAEIIYLAIKGYLKINQLDGKVLGIFNNTDFEIVKMKDYLDLPNAHDIDLMQSLLTSKESVRLSSLKQKFYIQANDVKRHVLDALVNKGYYKNLGHMKGIGKRMLTYLILGIPPSAFLGLVIRIINDIGLLTSVQPFPFIVGMLVSIVVFGIVSYFNPAKTEKGVASMEYLLGLKEYLQIAEKDRLHFHNAPEKRPEVFEALLPYAMVLGVAHIWAKEFEGLYTVFPSWYSGTSSSFNTLAFADSLDTFIESTTSIAQSKSSGSGSGGGGSSGGGGGGGGGGSW